MSGERGLLRAGRGEHRSVVPGQLPGDLMADAAGGVRYGRGASGEVRMSWAAHPAVMSLSDGFTLLREELIETRAGEDHHLLQGAEGER